MSQTPAPVCADGGSTSTKERKRAAQRDWWEREGKARRAAAREQEDARAVSQYDLSEPVDEVPWNTPNLQSRLGYAEEETRPGDCTPDEQSTNKRNEHDPYSVGLSRSSTGTSL